MTHQEFLTDLFEEWSNDDLAEFIFDARAYADDRQTGRALTRAAEIAGKLAEAELDAREALQRKISQEIYADLDAMYAQRKWEHSEAQHAASVDAEADYVPF